MNRWLFFCFYFWVNTVFAQDFETTFEKSGGTQSVNYKQLISFYSQLDKQYETVKMTEVGETDALHPLHVVYFHNSGLFELAKWKAEKKIIILINNGIHPGEPDGIDASMLLLRDAATGKIKVPDNIVLAVILVYNIGGMLNRGSHSRANQNGPVEYGFRGNSQNLDLNRDFIKMDAKETQSLVSLFHQLDPDIFIDNHVSNGADYQHIMTLLTSQHNKLGGAMGKYVNEIFEPALYKHMANKGYDLVPYVNHWGNSPEKGWVAFHEGPRFASGYATLLHTYAFVSETHMLKPFKQRVEATYALMNSFIWLASVNAADLIATRTAQKTAYLQQKNVSVAWQSDTSQHTLISFKGYEAGYKPSEVSGKARLYYDHNKPYEKQVKFYNNYTSKKSVSVPVAYIIPRGWGRAIERLKINKVKMQEVDKDTFMQVGVYYIESYETTPKPYEGHYLHSNVKVRLEKRFVKVYQGDYIVLTNQPAKRYLIETLEPTAPDAFFAWGFFDAVLQQKEGYSDYVFEDEAAIILKRDTALQQKLREQKNKDARFAEDGEAQLDFVYKQSAFYEPVHMRYPIYRLE